MSVYKRDKLFIGFSLETENLVKNSYKKLVKKQLDLIVATKSSKSHNPFGDNRLDAYIIDKACHTTKIKQKKKAFIAHVLLDKIDQMWY